MKTTPKKSKTPRTILLTVEVGEQSYDRWIKRQLKITPPNPATGQPYTEAHFRRVAFALGMLTTDTEVLP